MTIVLTDKDYGKEVIYEVVNIEIAIDGSIAYNYPDKTVLLKRENYVAIRVIL